jgi:hypothetical protein
VHEKEIEVEIVSSKVAPVVTVVSLLKKSKFVVPAGTSLAAFHPLTILTQIPVPSRVNQ